MAGMNRYCVKGGGIRRDEIEQRIPVGACGSEHMEDALPPGSGLVCGGVEAQGREVVSLTGMERPRRLVHPLPNRVLRYGGKRPQDG